MGSEHIPETIAERYQIKSVLGRGGMGMVLHAYDPFLAIDVAVKFMRSDDSGMTAARMQKEAMAAGKLKHANIARVYDFGKTSDDEPYMVMELLQGQSLSERIQELKPSLISAKEAISIFIQICDGLLAAHSASIVHRDLKPDNVFILENGVVKLVDFGIAQIGKGDQTHTHTTRGFEGSPLYMSPEQAKSEETDARSDIYSLGCLMFEVLSGKPPFEGKSALETISMQINSPPPLLDESIQSSLPIELLRLVESCLQKNPQSRPQNCGVVLQALESAQTSLKLEENSQIKTKAIETATEILIQKEENLLKLMICMVVLLVITTAGGFYVVFTQKKQHLFQTAKPYKKIELTQEPEQMLWPKSEVKISDKNKFEFGEYEGTYMVRPRLGVTDEDLKLLKGYVRLRYLLFDFAQLDGSGLAYVADLPLTRFQNNFGSLKNENLKYLAKMKTLEHLSFSSPFLTDEGLKQLLPLKKLVALGIGSDKITDRSVATFAQFQNLNTFSLWAPLISDSIFTALNKMKNLETVYLMKLKVNPDIGIKLARLKHLKNLGLMELSGLSDESFKAISKLKLNWLELGDTKLGENQLSLLSENLGGIGLRKTAVSSRNLENLKRLKLLNKLDLSDNKLSDEHIKILTRLKLTEVSLARTNLTFKQLLLLSNMSTLKKLNIQDCADISPDQLIEFQREFNLKHRHDCEVKFGAVEDEILERINPH